MEELILRCSDGIPRELLLQKGLCRELRERLSVVLGVDISTREMGTLLSRLGKAKYALYTPGAKFNRRRARGKRGPQGDPESVATHMVLAVSDFLDENLSSRIEWAVDDWLCGKSVAGSVETESVCSEDPSHPQLVWQTGGATSSTHSCVQDGAMLATASTDSTLSHAEPR